MTERQKFAKIGDFDQLTAGGISFPQLVAQAQRENAAWIEERFQTIRRSRPFVNCILVDGQGKVVQYWEPLRQQQPLPALEEIAEMAREKGELLYPLVSQRDTLIFFLSSLLEFLAGEKRLGELEARPYGRIGQEEVMLAFVCAGILGRLTKDLTQGNLVLGKIGFWPIREKDRPKILGFRVVTEEDREEMVTTGHLPRVHIKRHPIGKPVYFTPLPRADVILAGKLPIDETRDVCRVEVPSGVDFILGSFLAYIQDERLRETPLLLYYPSPRPG